MISQTTKFRLYVFDTLALALASTRTFEYGTIIMIKGDPTRVKFGAGISLSFDTPAAPTAQTFSQLPWFSGGTNASNPLVVNATATLTGAQIAAKRYITSTSAAATGITLPTATDLGAVVGATQGTEFDFEVDNSAGASTVTVIVNTGIVAATPVITGGATLTVAAGTFGKFKIIFKTPTTALIFRTL